MNKKRSKSDPNILDTGEYYQKREYGYDTIHSETIFRKPRIANCIYTPFLKNRFCKYCYKNIEDHVKNISIRKSPILIDTEPTSNDQYSKSIRKPAVLVDYKNHWTSWLWW